MAPADTAPPLLPWHFPAACAALQRSWALQARPPHAPPSDSLRPAAARIAHIPGDIIEWRLQRDPAMPGGAVLAASKRVSLGCTEGLARRISERSSPGPHPSAELDPDVDSPATFASCVDDSSRLGTSEAMATSCGERHPTDAFLLGEGDPAAAIEEHVERSSGSAVLRLWVSYSETYMCPELCFSVIAVQDVLGPSYRDIASSPDADRTFIHPHFVPGLHQSLYRVHPCQTGIVVGLLLASPGRERAHGGHRSVEETRAGETNTPGGDARRGVEGEEGLRGTTPGEDARRGGEGEEGLRGTTPEGLELRRTSGGQGEGEAFARQSVDQGGGGFEGDLEAYMVAWASAFLPVVGVRIPDSLRCRCGPGPDVRPPPLRFAIDVSESEDVRVGWVQSGRQAP